jgi:hypothetical protein
VVVDGASRRHGGEASLGRWSRLRSTAARSASRVPRDLDGEVKRESWERGDGCGASGAAAWRERGEGGGLEAPRRAGGGHGHGMRGTQPCACLAKKTKGGVGLGRLEEVAFARGRKVSPSSLLFFYFFLFNLFCSGKNTITIYKNAQIIL